MKFREALLAAGSGLLALAGSASAQQVQMQFPNAGWQAYAPQRVQCGQLYAANMNTTADQPIPVSVPSATYMVAEIIVSNPSVSLTTAAGGFYSAASKGGVAIVAAAQAYSGLTTNAANTTGNALVLSPSTAGGTTDFGGPQGVSPVKTIYFSLTTAQGAAATADIRVICRPLY